MLRIKPSKDGGATIEVDKNGYFVLMNSLYEAKSSYERTGLNKMAEEALVLWSKFSEVLDQ